MRRSVDAPEEHPIYGYKNQLNKAPEEPPKKSVPPDTYQAIAKERKCGLLHPQELKLTAPSMHLRDYSVQL